MTSLTLDNEISFKLSEIPNNYTQYSLLKEFHEKDIRSINYGFLPIYPIEINIVAYLLLREIKNDKLDA